MLGIIYLTSLAAILGAMGCYILIKRISLFVSANRAIGHFVRWEERGLRSKRYFHPIVRFRTPDGSEYEFVGMPGSSRKYEKTHYPILYPAGNPQAAAIHSFTAFWAAPIVFLVLAGCVAFAAFQQ